LWAEFLAFQAWKQATEEVGKGDQPALKAIDPERAEWEEAAKRVGVKPDGRWSLEKLKAKVQEAAEARVLVDAAPEPQPEQTA
jgi:ABC-type thiamine transport system ATPase subunit